jgi:hypothetical protein
LTIAACWVALLWCSVVLVAPAVAGPAKARQTAAIRGPAPSGDRLI